MFEAQFVIVQKTVNTAGPGTPSLGLLTRLVSGTWIWGGSLPFSDSSRWLATRFTPSTCFLFFGVWNSVHARQRVSMRLAPRKNPRRRVSNELPWQTTCHTCCHSSTLEGLNTSSVTPLEEDSWKLAAGVLGTWLHVPFPSANCVCVPCHKPQPWVWLFAESVTLVSHGAWGWSWALPTQLSSL